MVPALLLVIGMTGCASGPMNEAVSTQEVPAAIGPYSQAIKVGNLLFLSGQIAIDPKTNQMNSGSVDSPRTPAAVSHASQKQMLGSD
jgi:2-iminobutanoate/2-iminopropanoate deaminase